MFAPPLVASRKTELLEEIQRYKSEANAVVLAHVYERLETAKLLSPHKKVILANPHAGCPMADMITAEQLRTFKAQYPGVPVVAYVNTSAAVKAESDICCTSANAVDVVRSLGVNQVLFVPDKHLGHYVQQQLPDVDVICWDGFCPAHLRIDVEELKRLKATMPHALVLVHPECDEPVKELADYIGSTTGILQQAHACDATDFIICTEDGVTERLRHEHPHKRFITPSKQQALCPNMKMTRLENVRNALRGDVAEVVLDDAVFAQARASIDRMLAVPVSDEGVSAGSAACRCKSSLGA
jgi:quinolinate synthase